MESPRSVLRHLSKGSVEAVHAYVRQLVAAGVPMMSLLKEAATNSALEQTLEDILLGDDASSEVLAEYGRCALIESGAASAFVRRVAKECTRYGSTSGSSSARNFESRLGSPRRVRKQCQRLLLAMAETPFTGEILELFRFLTRLVDDLFLDEGLHVATRFLIVRVYIPALLRPSSITSLASARSSRGTDALAMTAKALHTLMTVPAHLSRESMLEAVADDVDVLTELALRPLRQALALVPPQLHPKPIRLINLASLMDDALIRSQLPHLRVPEPVDSGSEDEQPFGPHRSSPHLSFPELQPKSTNYGSSSLFSRQQQQQQQQQQQILRSSQPDIVVDRLMQSEPMLGSDSDIFPSEWRRMSADDVYRGLSNYDGLTEAALVLRSNKIDGRKLDGMDESELIRLGILKLGQRKRLLRVLGRRTSSEDESVPNPSAAGMNPLLV